MYGPNGSLIDRNDLQVSLDELNDHGFGTDDYESFESGLGTPPPTFTPSFSRVINISSSTPVGPPSYHCVHRSQSQLPAVSPQPCPQHLQPNTCVPPQSGNIIGMLQEQQALLHRIINEQEEMSKSVKKNNERIAILKAHLNDQSESSSSNSSSGEKQRLITKDLTVSSVSAFSTYYVITACVNTGKSKQNQLCNGRRISSR